METDVRTTSHADGRTKGNGEYSAPLDRLREMIGHAFEIYGAVVARRPLPFLVGPLLLTAALMGGFLLVEVQDDLRFLYSPSNGRSRIEYAIHQNFTGEGQRSTYCALAIESSNSSKNLLTNGRTALIQKLNHFVLRNLTFTLGNRTYHFGRQICPKIPLCPQSNKIVDRFIKVYRTPKEQRTNHVQLTYPIMKYFGAEFFLPSHLYGVETSEKDGAIRTVKLVHLIYAIPGTSDAKAEQVAEAVEQALKSQLSLWSHTGLSIYMFSHRILKQEVNKNTSYTFPYISVTVALLVAFTVVSCLTSDWLTSKPIEALLGIFSSALAILSSAGLLFYFGVPFITQVTVMPFLALAIGIDDTYIILGAWQRNDRRLAPERRLALTLRDAGSAITVTSLTDCLSFAIGAFSTTPAIAIFCKFVAASIMFDYLYQITFFAAVVALGGRREWRGYHSVFVWHKIDPKVVVKARNKTFSCPIDKFVKEIYGKAICSPLIRIAVLLIYGAYLFLAIYGTAKLRPNLTPSKLVVDDSPLAKYISLAQKYIWAEGLVGRIYINTAPDFENTTNLARFLKFARELESTPYSMGSNSTQLWIRAFLKYKRYITREQPSFYGSLQAFLRVHRNRHWRPFLRWRKLESNNSRPLYFVHKFFLTSGFQVKNWPARTRMLLAWRAVCDRYPDYQAVVYDEHNFYGDQVLALPNTTIKALGVCMLAMCFICLVFIAERHIVFWVIFTLLSMDIGIAGFLSLWGADLSPTTVVNILMSIGLSVDFATHVAYKIYLTKNEDKDGRIQDALASIAWPVMQGGVSTLLAIVVMLMVPSHVVRVFARTTILVVLFGMFHGLVLLPVILRTLDSRKSGWTRDRKILTEAAIMSVEHTKVC